MSRIHDASIAISNGLVDVAGWLEDHGHQRGSDRVIGFRSGFDRVACKLVLGHPRIMYGPMRDICLDCLTVVDEHPNGRGRALREGEKA